MDLLISLFNILPSIDNVSLIENGVGKVLWEYIHAVNALYE